MKERDKTKEQRVAEERVAGLQMSETQHKRKERRGQEAREYSESIINAVRESLIVPTLIPKRDQNIEHANSALDRWKGGIRR